MPIRSEWMDVGEVVGGGMGGSGNVRAKRTTFTAYFDKLVTINSPLRNKCKIVNLVQIRSAEPNDMKIAIIVLLFRIVF